MRENGPAVWKYFAPVRADPNRVGEILRSEGLAELTRGMTDREYFTAVNNALTMSLAEVAHWRVFADSVEQVFPSHPGSLIDPRIQASTPEPQLLFDPRHEASYRADQEAFMRSLLHKFEAAVAEVFRHPSRPHLEDPEHPYYPIRDAQIRFQHEHGVGNLQDFQTDMLRSGRQQFVFMLLSAERIVGPWGAMRSPDAGSDPLARPPETVADLASAVLHNLPRVLQTMRISPGAVEAVILGMISRKPGSIELIRDTFGEAALQDFEAQWDRMQEKDFSDDLSRVQGWSLVGGKSLPDIALNLFPTGKDKSEGRAPSGFQVGPKGRCPAPEVEPVARALSLVGPDGNPDWAVQALTKYRTLQRSGLLPHRGAARAALSTALAETILFTTAVHLGKLVGGRVTAMGHAMADCLPWGRVAGIGAEPRPFHTVIGSPARRPRSSAPTPRKAGPPVFQAAAPRR